jgi:anti-sigma regulatory factor (Ser/Thr protein kinase)
MIGRRHRGARARRLVLPGRPESVAEARALVLVLGELTEAQAWNAALVLSELLTNAILHSRSGLPGGTVTVTLEPTGSTLRITVRDDGPVHGRHASPRATGELDESGRGLRIVAAVSCACDLRVGGHTSWAEVAA